MSRIASGRFYFKTSLGTDVRYCIVLNKRSLHADRHPGGVRRSRGTVSRYFIHFFTHFFYPFSPVFVVIFHQKAPGHIYLSRGVYSALHGNSPDWDCWVVVALQFLPYFSPHKSRFHRHDSLFHVEVATEVCTWWNSNCTFLWLLQQPSMMEPCMN